jgi:hypothetical protein
MTLTLRGVASNASLLVPLLACAATIPRAELERCELGAADGNDKLALRQGAACRVVAQRLFAADDVTAAAGYARKACQLQDARGCEGYLDLVKRAPSLLVGELRSAREAGEKACAGMVLAEDGVDVRPRICARTAELYLDVEPRSPRDAGELYARSCALGDAESCGRARALGVEVSERPVAVARATARAPVASATPEAPAVRSPPGVCHPMRSCVALDVQQHNASEVLGTLTNHCDRAVFCSFCPARGGTADKSSCRTATLAPNESKSGRNAGLWYDGYTAIAYDCADATDDRGCTP